MKLIVILLSFSVSGTVWAIDRSPAVEQQSLDTTTKAFLTKCDWVKKQAPVPENQICSAMVECVAYLPRVEAKGGLNHRIHFTGHAVCSTDKCSKALECVKDGTVTMSRGDVADRPLVVPENGPSNNKTGSAEKVGAAH